MTDRDRYRDRLRIRRYLDNEFVDERELTRDQGLADVDAEWAMMASEAGHRWRIVIDDPAGDLSGAVVLSNEDGGAE
jgi:hypothetical protein